MYYMGNIAGNSHLISDKSTWRNNGLMNIIVDQETFDSSKEKTSKHLGTLVMWFSINIVLPPAAMPDAAARASNRPTATYGIFGRESISSVTLPV